MNSTQAIILELRSKGLSQSEIARRIGMPQPRVSRWEAGEVPTGADDALKLAALLREVQANEAAAAPSGAESDAHAEAGEPVAKAA